MPRGYSIRASRNYVIKCDRRKSRGPKSFNNEIYFFLRLVIKAYHRCCPFLYILILLKIQYIYILNDYNIKKLQRRRKIRSTYRRDTYFCWSDCQIARAKYAPPLPPNMWLSRQATTYDDVRVAWSSSIRTILPSFNRRDFFLSCETPCDEKSDGANVSISKTSVCQRSAVTARLLRAHVQTIVAIE